MIRTHEDYIGDVIAAVTSRVSSAIAAMIAETKISYGKGAVRGARGVTFFSRWNAGVDSCVPFVEICADGEESLIQLAGTICHEIGHVVAGYQAGHGKDWRLACASVGLRHCRAAGHRYNLADFVPDLRWRIASIPAPTDGAPVRSLSVGTPGTILTPKPCGAGIGTRGGRSRGAGSGSRSLKVTCEECGYTARVTRKWLDVGAPHCGAGHGPMVEAD